MKRIFFYAIVCFFSFFIYGEETGTKSILDIEEILMTQQAVQLLEENNILDSEPESEKGLIHIAPPLWQNEELVFSLFWVERISKHLLDRGYQLITPQSLVLSEKTLDELSPQYVLRGEISMRDNELFLLTQLSTFEQGTVLGSRQLRLSRTADLVAMLILESSSRIPDFYEPDSREKPIVLNEAFMTFDRALYPAGDEDWFSYIGDTEAYIGVATTGPTDTYLEIYSSERGDHVIAENDDYYDHNAALEFLAAANVEYFIKVRGYNAEIEGPYTFHFAHFPDDYVFEDNDF